VLGVLLRIGLIAGVIFLGACGNSSSTSKPDAPQAFNVTAGE
jgi:hypothetical protein